MRRSNCPEATEPRQAAGPARSDPPLLVVSVDDRATTRTITPRGEVDSDSAGFVAKPLMQALTDRFEVVVLDLSQTTLIDATGIAVVVGATERARERAIGFLVVPGPAAVQRAFDRAGLTQLVPFGSQRRHDRG
jgi:anti-anti-sigma factor